MKKSVFLAVVAAVVSAFGYAPRTYDVRSEAMDKSVPAPVLHGDGVKDDTAAIRDVTREEHCLQDPTIGIAKGCRIDRLIVRDCSQVNMTDKPVTFLHTNGEIGELVRENVRLVAAPGDNVDFDDKTEYLRR